MGMFTRRRAPAITWHPDSDEPVAVPASCVCDAECAGGYAYAVTFTLAQGPATLTIWVYPVPSPADAPAPFTVRYLCEYATGAGERWTCLDTAPDPYPDNYRVEGALMDGLPAADYVAYAMAAVLASITRGPGDGLLHFFGWDGQPFNPDEE